MSSWGGYRWCLLPRRGTGGLGLGAAIKQEAEKERTTSRDSMIGGNPAGGQGLRVHSDVRVALTPSQKYPDVFTRELPD